MLISSEVYKCVFICSAHQLLSQEPHYVMPANLGLEPHHETPSYASPLQLKISVGFDWEERILRVMLTSIYRWMADT